MGRVFVVGQRILFGYTVFHVAGVVQSVRRRGAVAPAPSFSKLLLYRLSALTDSPDCILQLLLGDAKFLRPISDLSAFLNVDSGAILRAPVRQVISHFKNLRLAAWPIQAAEHLDLWERGGFDFLVGMGSAERRRWIAKLVPIFVPMAVFWWVCVRDPA